MYNALGVNKRPLHVNKYINLQFDNAIFTRRETFERRRVRASNRGVEETPGLMRSSSFAGVI